MKSSIYSSHGPSKSTAKSSRVPLSKITQRAKCTVSTFSIGLGFAAPTMASAFRKESRAPALIGAIAVRLLTTFCGSAMGTPCVEFDHQLLRERSVHLGHALGSGGASEPGQA